MASVTSQNGAANTEPTNILALPELCLKEILSHCSQGDLICLSLVCKQFRELAAAQIYRNFHIVFPDEDDQAYESSIDGLAGGLDTFVTSQYDYAKHLRDLSLDTLSAGSKAEAAYKPYLYSVSCGKFMNTLLLLTLRKARSLETFTWNIRVELSRPVYSALHDIKTLKHLHLRLQAGPSLYETPPSLPYPAPPMFESTFTATASHSTSIAPPPPQPPPIATFSSAPPPPVFYVGTPTSLPPPPPPPKPPARTRPPKKSGFSVNEPPTLSGFKDLKTLAVLDIDSLDVITEIKKCVRNSSSSLSKLKLSFSDSLASQARKPPPEIDPEDSDVDDEFQVVPVTQSSGQNIDDDATGPAKAFRAQEERKTQEAVLGRIFEVEPYVVKKGPKPPARKEDDSKGEKSPGLEPGEDFVNAIKIVSQKLIKDRISASSSDAAKQEILDIIVAAAKKYVNEKDPETKQQAKEGGEPSATAGTMPGTSSTATGPGDDDEDTELEAQNPGSSTSLFGQTSTKGKDPNKDVNPDDIDVERPEDDKLVLEPGDSPSTPGKDSISPDACLEASLQPSRVAEVEASAPADVLKLNVPPELEGLKKALATLNTQRQNFQTLTDKLMAFRAQADKWHQELFEHRTGGTPLDAARVREAEQEMAECNQTVDEIQKEMANVQAEILDAEKLALPLMGGDKDPASKKEKDSKRMKDYVRSTRGIGLDSLAVHLIPVKASVLSKAVDLRMLTKITLLNVGSQAPIWMQFAKENKLKPIALRKIFTDNVGSAFLTFVSQLEELHELFILERDSKHKPESFAPATTTTISHIRRCVLKRHLPTLKRLMIKNMASHDWDVDEKSILLITRKAKQLEELSMSMNMSAIHILSQNLFGLQNLRALHVIQLRNDDTCMWVMRETKRFLIDNLSHYPEMKLEWISIDDEYRVERIVRPDDPESKRSQKNKGKKGKGKAKAKAGSSAMAVHSNINNSGGGGGGLGSSNTSSMFPVLPLDALDGLSDSSSDEGGEEDDDSFGLKLETIENLPYFDVWGVKIFKKEVVNGRL